MPEKPEFRFAALILSAVCVIVFVLSQIFHDFFYAYFTLVSDSVWYMPWMLVTHMFMHANVVHLLSNLFALALFGSILEKYIGWDKFLYVFFIGGIAAALGSIMWYNSSLGASGAVFAILGTLATLRPRQVVWVLGVPMYVIIAAFIWSLLDLMGMFYPDNVAHVAHLFGLVFGLGLGLWLRRIYPPPKQKKRSDDIEISEESLRRWEEKYMRY